MIHKKNGKFYSGAYTIASPYFLGDSTKIVVASDIHYHSHVDKGTFLLLVKYCREIKPDLVVMPGDLIETINFIDSPKEREFFEGIIKAMAETASVIIIPGNHEIGNFDVNNCCSRNYVENVKALRYFDSLNRIRNVYFLNNTQISLNGMTFFGFNPRIATYLKKDDKKTNEMFIEDYLKSGLKMSEEDYNVLLTHSPILLTDSNIIENISDFRSLTDLAITGHLHDGYLPKCFDKLLEKTNIGLFFTPFVAPVPGMVCRGVHDFGRGYLFISQGFRKFTADIGLFNAFEQITANDVEQLTITNAESLSAESQESKRMKLTLR